MFEKPYKVEPVYEWWETPLNYRSYPGGKELPDELKVWRVQKTTEKPGETTRPYGAVSRDWKSDKKLDAEALAVGYNNGKMSGAVAVGRQRNFLQWGFSAPPSNMTDAGRKFFLNCICYIARFEGRVPGT